MIEPSNKKRKTNGVSPREYERLRQVAYGRQSVKDVIKSDDAPNYDPWATTKPEDEVQDPRFSYLEKRKPIQAPMTLKEAPISLAAGKGSVPALPEPKPGTSYNPVAQDWEALLASEGQKEVVAEKKRLREAEIEKERLDRIAAAEHEREHDDIQTEDESAWGGFESDYSGAEWLKKKRPERKTPTERNKFKRRKEAERREKWEKKEKERGKQLKQIGEIIKRAKDEAKAKALVTAKGDSSEDDEEVDDRVLRRRRLGKDAYVLPSIHCGPKLKSCSLSEPSLELVLPDELRDSLRLLKPEGNLLNDRFRSILVRGKMETRKSIQQGKKKRRSVTEKWSYKDFEVPT